MVNLKSFTLSFLENDRVEFFRRNACTLIIITITIITTSRRSCELISRGVLYTHNVLCVHSVCAQNVCIRLLYARDLFGRVPRRFTSDSNHNAVAKQQCSSWGFHTKRVVESSHFYNRPERNANRFDWNVRVLGSHPSFRFTSDGRFTLGRKVLEHGASSRTRRTGMVRNATTRRRRTVRSLGMV